MEPFVFDVGEGGLISGLKNFPLQPDPTKQTGRGKGMPLMICLHGSTYCAKYFDAHDNYSIRKASSLLNIPVLALNRPGYKQTPDLAKCSNTGTDTHLQNEAAWLHRLVLPLLWRAFGPSLGCTSLVLNGHDSGGAIAMLIASLHGADKPKEQPYPLSGLIMSGLGAARTMQLNKEALEASDDVDDTGQPKSWTFKLGPKTRLMLNSEMGQSPIETIKTHESINCPAPSPELDDFSSPGPDGFATYFRRPASSVAVPILYFLSDGNLLWDTSQEKIQDFASAFMSSPRVEWGVFRGAGHCIELSWLGPSWYVKCCGFAMEAAVESELLEDFISGRYSLPSHLSTVRESGREGNGSGCRPGTRESGISENSIEQAWPKFPG